MEEKDIILSKWLQGQVSDEEVTALLPDVDLSNLKETLLVQENFEISANDPEAQWDVFESNLSSKEVDSSKRNPLKWILLLALFVAGVISLYFIFNNSSTTIKADSNEFLNYAFEDGSTIKLWPGSSITFDESNYMNERIIKLNGEGFFDVEKGNTFRVQTKAGEVEVLGTSFNVWAADKKNTDVKCYTGRVRVTDKYNRSVVLTAGKKVRISEKNVEGVLTFDLESQRNNASLKYYDKASVEWVITDFKNLYNVDFDIKRGLRNKRFSGAISVVDLDKALSYLCESMQWNYEIENERIFITD